MCQFQGLMIRSTERMFLSCRKSSHTLPYILSLHCKQTWRVPMSYIFQNGSGTILNSVFCMDSCVLQTVYIRF